MSPIGLAKLHPVVTGFDLAGVVDMLLFWYISELMLTICQRAATRPDSCEAHDYSCN
jgi:hypothetical protein